MTAITADHPAAPRKSFRDVWPITLGHALTHWYPAPIVIGSLLTVFSWRTIVVGNVVPGVVISFLIFALLGSVQFSRKSAKRAESEAGQSLREYFRGVPALFRNRGLILLSTSSAFRSMTQNALLTFLPLYLAYEIHYSPVWVGACMFVL